MSKGSDVIWSTPPAASGSPQGEKLIKVRFKDPQQPPDQAVQVKYVNYFGSVYEALNAARDAFNIPLNVPIALLYKGRRLNVNKRLSDYEVQEDALLLIVPDKIKGG